MKPSERLTSMQLAARYGVSVRMLDTWKLYAGCPRHAAIRDGNRLLWNYDIVDEWLRSRSLAHTGHAPRWLAIVGHPQADARA